MVKQMKRYRSLPIVAAMQDAWYQPRCLGRSPTCGRFFSKVNEFMLVSVCATLYCILKRWEQGPTSWSKKDNSPLYAPLDPPTMAFVFEQKMGQWQRQSQARREGILAKLTKEVVGVIQTNRDDLLDDMVTEPSQYADTLEGIDSEDEDSDNARITHNPNAHLPHSDDAHTSHADDAHASPPDDAQISHPDDAGELFVRGSSLPNPRQSHPLSGGGHDENMAIDEAALAAGTQGRRSMPARRGGRRSARGN